MIRIECGDCIEVMRTLPDNSVDLIATDPPYHRVKSDAWDRQWKSDADYLAWLDDVAAEWFRLLKPNGSLYCFASPRMAARVEVLLGQRFNVLNRITWRKPPFATKAEMSRKEDLRTFFPASEAIIFAEHRGADGGLFDEGTYNTALGKLREVVFADLRNEIGAVLDRVPGGDNAINQLLGTQNVTFHWRHFKTFNIPTQRNWRILENAFPDAITIAWPELKVRFEKCRAEYEALRREYDDLRRPFSVTVDVPYTDVWDFPTVQAYRGKHPCEKPLEMMRHIIRASSRPGATALDCFAGSGVVGQAAKLEGRSAILIEHDPQWVAKIHDRLKIEQTVNHRLFETVNSLPLFGGQAA